MKRPWGCCRFRGQCGNARIEPDIELHGVTMGKFCMLSGQGLDVLDALEQLGARIAAGPMGGACGVHQ
jgi:hypothetical protein